MGSEERASPVAGGCQDRLLECQPRLFAALGSVSRRRAAGGEPSSLGVSFLGK